MPIQTDASIENADIWYMNFLGYFDYYAYTDANNIYSGFPSDLPGSFVATVDSIFNQFEMMSDLGTAPRTVDSEQVTDINANLVAGYTNQYIFYEV